MTNNNHGFNYSFNNNFNNNRQLASSSLNSSNIGNLSSTVGTHITGSFTIKSPSLGNTFQDELEELIEEKMDFYLKAIIILLNQKGIMVNEGEIEDIIDAIKIMNKLTEE